MWEKRDPFRLELEVELRRVWIVCKKAKCDQIGKLLEKRNDELEKLLQVNDDLAPIRKRRQTGQNTLLLQKLRRRAKQLHTALDGAWSCSCQGAHPVNLLLERRVREKSIIEDNWRLHLLDYAMVGQAAWQEIEVHMFEENAPTERRPEIFPDSSSHQDIHYVKERLDFKTSQEAARESLGRSAIASATSIASGIAGQGTFGSL